jgi:hypothetical protein
MPTALSKFNHAEDRVLAGMADNWCKVISTNTADHEFSVHGDGTTAKRSQPGDFDGELP